MVVVVGAVVVVLWLTKLVVLPQSARVQPPPCRVLLLAMTRVPVAAVAERVSGSARQRPPSPLLLGSPPRVPMAVAAGLLATLAVLSAGAVVVVVVVV